MAFLGCDSAGTLAIGEEHMALGTFMAQSLFSRIVAMCFIAFTIAACASGQLNYNTLDLARTVDDLVTSQVVYNLGKFVVDPYSNPTQVAISTGSITTTNQVSLSWANPLNSAVTTTSTAATAAGAVLPAITRTTSGVAGSATLTPSGTNQASQNWSISTDTDPDQERRLRALYRFATHTDYNTLCSEYPLIVTQGSIPSPVPASVAEADQGAWTAATNADSVPAYLAYLRTFPRGFHVPAAHYLKLFREQHPDDTGLTPDDKTLWLPAVKTDTPQSYSVYLRAGNNPEHKNLASRSLIPFAIRAQGAISASKSTTQVTSVSTPSGSMTVTALDAQFLREPSCVICSNKANEGNINVDRARSRYYCPVPRVAVSDLYVNPKLKNKWLRAIPADYTLDTPEFTYIGRYENLSLYTADPDQYRQFVLFILEATSVGSTTGQSGKGGPSKQGPSPNIAGPQFTVIP
jgi:hypothetical protein